MSARTVELIPGIRFITLVGWAAVTAHALAITGILVAILTNGN
jgi:hypothetical protein